MNEILERMAALSTDFRNSGMFQPKLLRQACADLGIEPDYELLHKSTRPQRGWYHYSAGGLSMEEIRKSAKTKKTQAAAPVEVPGVQVAEVVVSEVKKHEKKIAKTTNFGFVPDRDPSYVPFGFYKDIETILKDQSFFPVYITGMSGNGKSSTVIEACARLKRPLIRIPVNKDTDKESLIGCKTLSDGNVVIEEGPLLMAMRSGVPILLEELDAGHPNNLMALQTIMEGRPYFFDLTGEYIVPAPGFNIFATGNTKGRGSDDGRYNGTNVLNDAFLERFAVTFEQEFPSESVENKMILNWMEANGYRDEQFASELARWAQAIRKTFFDGGLDDLVAPRRVQHIVRAYKIFGDKTKAVQLGTGRFDSTVAESFRTVFSKIMNPEKAPETVNVDLTDLTVSPGF